MIDKSKAPRSGKYFNLDFVVAAISALNQHTEDKFYLRIKERDDVDEDLAKPYLVEVDILCTNVVIFNKQFSMLKSWDENELRKRVMNACARIISDCVASGLVNYKLATDSLAESYAQEHFGQDRISIIKKIIQFPPQSTPGVTRGWSWYSKADGAAEGIGNWEIMEMLDGSYEDLIKCLDELTNGEDQ